MKTSKVLKICSLIIIVHYVAWMAFLFLGTTWEKDRFDDTLFFTIPIQFILFLHLPFYLKKMISGKQFFISTLITYGFLFFGVLISVLFYFIVFVSLEGLGVSSEKIHKCFDSEIVIPLLVILSGIITFLQGINLKIRKIERREYLIFSGGLFISAILTILSGRIYFYEGFPHHNDLLREFLESFKMGYPFLWFSTFFVIYSIWLIDSNHEKEIPSNALSLRI